MGWKIRLRSREGCVDPTPFLSPDIVILNQSGPEIRFDMALAEADETSNVLGLRSKEHLHTAILIQLFTDRRIRDGMEHADPANPNPFGWFGDSVDVRPDLGETELGSHLWTLRRSILNDDIVALAGDFTLEALQPIVDQGAVARFDVETEALHADAAVPYSILAIGIRGFSQVGTSIYDQHFEVLWDEIRRLAA